MTSEVLPYRLGQAFGKTEKLNSEKIIAGLFQSGVFVSKYPLRANLLITELPVQVVFTASKRKFKRAVDRNFVKRRLREVYRQNKLPLYQAIEVKGITVAIALMYTGTDLPDMKQLEKSYQVILKKIYDVLELPNP
jgi:ribonuclease P protein component